MARRGRRVLWDRRGGGEDAKGGGIEGYKDTTWPGTETVPRQESEKRKDFDEGDENEPVC